MSATHDPLRLTIIGAAGRMGLELIRAVSAAPDLRVTGAVASTRSPHLGRDIGELAGGAPVGVRLTSDLEQTLDGCDVVMEFTRASSTLKNLASCLAARKPLLIGTSGLRGLEFDRKFAEAARDIPLLLATNACLGATLLAELVREAASKLPKTFEVEILEAHDDKKEDAPSGTALSLGRIVADVRGQEFEEVAVTGSRVGLRRPGSIGYAVIRAGDVVDEHTVFFYGMGEHLALTHRATDYGIFVRGALAAAKWLAPQAKGLYRMRDVLGYQ